MKIVYVSYLPETMSGGPKYSVPHQVDSQSCFDRVYWINMTNVEMIDSTIKPINIFKCQDVVFKICDIKPDLVVFEDLYYFSFYRIASKLRRHNIPYVIKPRGSMTCFAQKKRAFKKRIANILFFNSFISNAKAIEYLNNGEKDTTLKRWKNIRSIIVPNGISIDDNDCSTARFSSKVIKGLFIGRIDVFHKGIDVFLEACSLLKSDLIERKCVFEFYGPCDLNEKEFINDYLRNNNLNDVISINDEVHGEKKRNLLRKCDFFVLTSRFEGMPMGLLEALSYGLPSIVTFGTNMGSEIVNYDAGFCSPCNVEGIKNNLIKIMSLNKDGLLKMSKNAKKLADEYDWNKIARNAHDSYNSLLK